MADISTNADQSTTYTTICKRDPVVDTADLHRATSSMHHYIEETGADLSAFLTAIKSKGTADPWDEDLAAAADCQKRLVSEAEYLSDDAEGHLRSMFGQCLIKAHRAAGLIPAALLAGETGTALRTHAFTAGMKFISKNCLHPCTEKRLKVLGRDPPKNDLGPDYSIVISR